jgi:hypothetical protein
VVFAILCASAGLIVGTKTRARYGLFCFGDVTVLAAVEASVEIDSSTGGRRGHIVASDGVGSVELTTATGPLSSVIGPATFSTSRSRAASFTAGSNGAAATRESGSPSWRLRQRSSSTALPIRELPAASMCSHPRAARLDSSTAVSPAARRVSTGTTERATVRRSRSPCFIAVVRRVSPFGLATAPHRPPRHTTKRSDHCEKRQSASATA